MFYLHLTMSCCRSLGGSERVQLTMGSIGHMVTWCHGQVLHTYQCSVACQELSFFNTWMSFCKFIQLCKHHYFCFRTLPLSPRISLSPFAVYPCSYPQLQANTDLLSVSIVFAFSRNFIQCSHAICRFSVWFLYVFEFRPCCMCGSNLTGWNSGF